MSGFKRYRERIERGDARRRWLIRATAFGVSTVIAALALLNAGVDPSKWGWWPFITRYRRCDLPQA